MRRSIHRAGTGTPPAPSRLAIVLAAGLSVLNVPAAQAQPAAPEVARAEGSNNKDNAAADLRDKREQLDTVIVTATRRREPVRDVPLRVETLAAADLERQGAASLSDTIGALPGVNVESGGGPGRGAVTIRGVNAGDQAIATVGVYVDDVAFGSTSAFAYGAVSALDMALLDLHHIELLRGPQGTLYGAGAMGGLLKYVTNEPDSTLFSGKVGLGVRASRGGELGHTESVVLNVPLSQNVAAVRVAAFKDHEGGYITAVGRATGDHVNDGNTHGARVSALIEPTTKLKMRLSAATQDIQRNNRNIVDYNIATGEPVYGELTHRLDYAEPYTIKTRLTSADVEYDFGWARLNVIASTQRFDRRNLLDASPLIPSFEYIAVDYATKIHKETQELRLTSQPGTVEWLLGYYRNKEVARVSQRLFGKGAPTGGAEVTLQGNAQPSAYREQAVYGDVTWNLDRVWSVTVGARVARNQQVYGVEGTPADFVGSSAESAKTYLGTLRYALDKNSNVYFRAASGYRPGGPNAPATDAKGQVIPDTPKTYEHDTLWSYELGYKADLLDKRLNVEAAVYDIRWNDLQQLKSVGLGNVIVNAGGARVRGVELATRYKLDAQWSLDGSLAWIDPKLTKDAIPALGPTGSRLTNTAKLSFSLGARYSFDLAGHPSYAGLNVRHVGQRNAGFDSPGTSKPNFSLPAYTLIDAQWGVEFGAWQLSTFVRNLADTRALLSADTGLTKQGLPLTVTPAAPRTIGANLSYNF